MRITYRPNNIGPILKSPTLRVRLMIIPNSQKFLKENLEKNLLKTQKT